MSWGIVMLVHKVSSPLILTQKGYCHRTKNSVNVASEESGSPVILKRWSN